MGSVKLLMEKEGGGAAWLQGLRNVPYLEASEALCSLPGVGPKVSMLSWDCLISARKAHRTYEMHRRAALVTSFEAVGNASQV